MIQRSTLTFLRGLKKHNNRTWFNQHKDDYRAALADMEALAGELIVAVSSFDPAVKGVQPKEALFRIYRDVRFAKDNTPYKTHFGAVIGPDGRKGGDAMYYFHLEPGNSFLAGGLHQPPSKELHKIRRAIDARGGALKNIISKASFKKLFGGVEGEQLKGAPRGYAAEHPHIDLLRYKDLLISHQLGDAHVLSPQLVRSSVHVFKAMKPFNDFLNRAMGRR